MEVGCNPVEYTIIVFLYSEWLYFLWRGIKMYNAHPYVIRYGCSILKGLNTIGFWQICGYFEGEWRNRRHQGVSAVSSADTARSWMRSDDVWSL